MDFGVVVQDCLAKLKQPTGDNQNTREYMNVEADSPMLDMINQLLGFQKINPTSHIQIR